MSRNEIEDMRVNLGVLQHQLGTIIGTSQTTVSIALSGKTNGTNVRVDERLTHIRYALEAVALYGFDAVWMRVQNTGPLRLESLDDVEALPLTKKNAA